MSGCRLVREGMTVISSDNAHVGRVMRCGDGRFEIEKGFFFPKDYLLEEAEVTRVDDKHAYLRLSREQLKAQWDDDERFGDAAATTRTARSPDRLAAGEVDDFRPSAHLGEEAYPTVSRAVEHPEIVGADDDAAKHRF